MNHLIRFKDDPTVCVIDIENDALVYLGVSPYKEGYAAGLIKQLDMPNPLKEKAGSTKYCPDEIKGEVKSD